MLIYLFSFLIVIKFAKKAMEYEEISKLEYLFMPLISLEMSAYYWKDLKDELPFFIR